MAILRLTSVPSATTTTQGKVRLATIAEAAEGTSEALAVTPAGLSNALAAALGGNTQIESFVVSDPPLTSYTLASAPTRDATDDAVCTVVLGGWTAEQGVDYTVAGAVVSWTSSDVALAPGERLIITYSALSL
jgi:hypothetical protein